MAKAVGDTTSYSLQQFIYRGQFSADRLRDELRVYVNEKLGEEDGVLVVDETGVTYRWVTGDCVYGDYRAIRLWLEDQRKCYALCVSGKEYLQSGWKRVSVSSTLKELDEGGWVTASCGDGLKGACIYDWKDMEIGFEPMEGWKRQLLVRRSKTDLRILLWLRYRVSQAIQSITLWIIWRREHQAVALWYHSNKTSLQL